MGGKFKFKSGPGRVDRGWDGSLAHYEISGNFLFYRVVLVPTCVTVGWHMLVSSRDICLLEVLVLGRWDGKRDFSPVSDTGI